MYLRASRYDLAADPNQTGLLHGPAMLVLDIVNIFLNIFLEITKTRLNLADVLLDISFYLHTLVIQYHASGFLDFTFGFFDSAFYLIFVHERLLIIM